MTFQLYKISFMTFKILFQFSKEFIILSKFYKILLINWKIVNSQTREFDTKIIFSPDFVEMADLACNASAKLPTSDQC